MSYFETCYLVFKYMFFFHRFMSRYNDRTKQYRLSTSIGGRETEKTIFLQKNEGKIFSLKKF